MYSFLRDSEVYIFVGPLVLRASNFNWFQSTKALHLDLKTVPTERGACSPVSHSKSALHSPWGFLRAVLRMAEFSNAAKGAEFPDSM